MYIWIILFLVIIAAVFFVVREFFFRSVFGRAPADMTKQITAFEKNMQGTPIADKTELLRKGRQWVADTPHRDVYITSFDGLRLHARLYPSGTHKNRTIVLCHGWKSFGGHDFGCICEWYSSLGLDILLIDQRAHGKSEGKYITFGTLERYDIREWCKYIVSGRPDEQIILGGISMGCTSVLLAAALPDMPPNLIGIVADCGFTNAYSQLKFVIEASNFPSKLILADFDRMCRRRAGWSLKSVDTTKEIKNIRVPVLFIHGGKDDFVPPENTVANYNSCTAPKTIVTVPDAGHGTSWLFDNAGCTAALEKFFASL